MKCVRVSKEDWHTIYAKDARMAVFGEAIEPRVERIDFAYLVADSQNQLVIYSTFYEMDHKSLYLGFGGSFPGSRGTPKTAEALLTLFTHLKSLGYTDINWHVKNENYPMLKLAMKVSAKIVGVSVTPRSTLLEHHVNLIKETN